MIIRITISKNRHTLPAYSAKWISLQCHKNCFSNLSALATVFKKKGGVGAKYNRNFQVQFLLEYYLQGKMG